MKLPFLRKQKRYLIVELLPDGERGLLFGIDANKEIVFRSQWNPFSLARFTKSWNFARKQLRVIAVVDAASSFSVKIPVDVKGRELQHALGAAELENIIGQIVSREFNQHRDRASRELGVQELDAVLINSRVGDFKIDGYRVVNPVGFAPKSMQAVIELTFTTRELFNRLKPLFEAQQDFFFTEAARAQLYSLLKTHQLPIGLVSLESGASPFYILESAAIGYTLHRGKLPWSIDAFPNALGAEWGIERPVAEKIYAQYRHDDVSSAVQRRIVQLFKPIEQAFFAELRRTKLSGNVFLRRGTELPFDPFGKRGRCAVQKPPLANLLRHMGFQMSHAAWPFSEDALFERLAPFVEYYYNNDNSEINHWLRRRLHWLGATMRTG